MRDLRLRVYHALPAWLRQLAASRHGRRLQRQRYGPETDRLVAEAHERETYTADDWREWHRAQLAPLLLRAATHVPHYREWLAGSGVPALADWPVLGKQTLRADPLRLLADDCNAQRMSPDRTSGTSGSPIVTWWSTASRRRWFAFFEARWRGWIGATRHDRWGMIGGALVVPVSRTRPPFWVANRGMNQLYVSQYHLREDWTDAIVGALERYRVRYICAYTSSVAQLARNMLATGRAWRGEPLLGVITNAEPLWPGQREVIGRAFGCPVRDTWGLSEGVAGASECDAGKLHAWPDAGVLEVFDDSRDMPVADGEAGRAIATGLCNGDMPLVRYDFGDRIRMAPASAAARCSCGRTLPIIDAIEGRSQDNLVAADGRRVFWFGGVFYGLPVVESQIEQHERGEVHVRFVPVPPGGVGAAPAQQTADDIRARLHQRLGESTRVVVHVVESIPHSANGKLRAVICHVQPPGEER